MQSFLIISKNKNTLNDEANKICKKFDIDNFDINILEKDIDNSIGIEDIRIFQQKISLKPFRSKFKSGIIKNAEKLTPEAQNALLKTLEEPPLNTILLLLSERQELLLPTVLSRCKIIELKEKTTEFQEKESAENHKILSSLSSCGIGERLKTAQNAGKTKEETLSFLENMILAARQQLISRVSNPSSSIFPAKQDLASLDNLKNLLSSFQKTYIIIKTVNVSPRLALENLFLNL